MTTYLLPVGAVTTAQVTDLTAGSDYQMRLRARDAAGNWSAWSTPVTFATDEDPNAAGLAVTLDEVKRHGNITGTASDDELLLFIRTAQEIIAGLAGPVVPTTVTAEHHAVGPRTLKLFLRQTPVLQVTAVQELSGITPLGALTAADWQLDTETGALARLSGSAYSYWSRGDVLVTYQAGRSPVPTAIRWAIMEQTIHLWRSTQAQRGGRGRGDASESAAAFGVPNRVRDALGTNLRTATVA